MALVFIGLGSNLGDGRANLREAWQRLGGVAELTPLTLSHPYRSAPLAMVSSHWFTNAVGVCESKLPPRELLARLLAIEAAMGRDRSQGRDRVIDLDILYYDDLVEQGPDLTLPHPEIENRLFVLAPLAELAPDHQHPLTGRSSREMLQRLAGQTVERIAWESRP